MSRIEKLIKEKCPDGVEYKKLGDLCSIITKQTGFDYSNHIKEKLLLEPSEDSVPYIQTKFFTGKRFDFKTDYYVPLSLAQQFPKITLNEKCLLFSIVGASIGNVGLYPGERMSFLGGAIGVAKVLPEYDVDYLFYCIEGYDFQRQILRKIKGAGQATITIEDIREFEIPVPPIEVQQEIVCILDKFTELEVELQAELDARKKQFSYYADELFTFSDVEKINVGNIAIIKTGSKPTQIIETETEYEYINAGTTNSGYVEGYNCDGDVVTTPSRGEGGIGFVGYQKKQFWLGPLCYKLQMKSNNVLAKYVYYYLLAKPELILQYKNTGGVPSLNVGDVAKIEIEVPSLVEQRKIVNILDKFETICNDGIMGLPAEIEARHKQYEYYRDKLLTFKRKVV